jgi:tRNA(Ile)-lysidine synthase
MTNKVVAAIEKYSLIENGDKVVVALSGGADSVTLLDVLCSLKEKYNLTIYAAHLNHNIRGEEAERDENFCKILCKNYNVELFVKSVDVKALAQKQKISEELCGRNERYSFFEELSSKLNAKIATAHTASDNAETLLFNLSRGSSLKGLSAIPPKRGAVIRPLIELTRSQIEQYCTEQNLNFVTDSTNLTDDYTRNSIRHRVVPVLKDFNPQLEAACLHLSENARELCEYLDRQTALALKACRQDFGYSCQKLLEQDRAILKNALVMLCRQQADFAPENRHIALMLDIIEHSGAVCLTNKLKAVSKQGIFRLDATEKSQSFEPVEFDCDLKINFYGKIYSTKVINSEKENNDSVSADFLTQNAIFRTRKEGDRFTYTKRKVTKPLRKVLNEMKIPSELRDKILVLAIDSTVLWCENIGVSYEGKNNSEKEVLIQIKEGV